jgi:hypothetical protein
LIQKRKITVSNDRKYKLEAVTQSAGAMQEKRNETWPEILRVLTTTMLGCAPFLPAHPPLLFRDGFGPLYKPPHPSTVMKEEKESK